ncbi:hypothetical protein M501DRAFT_995116 [Patellaria atrata CBS 101060]|uniref:Uncharacterized protein n=1 Tax=Patellaria atrata CBS 101060 TaxID=1346257 RepID=A0A9P4S8J0_9PEZI|nr:hypothetical protein M501DRAFT_995116 [Patellaria atrata CBS 101060]
MINFTECGLRYMSNQTLIDKYGWTGVNETEGIPYNRSSQITTQGCYELCGSDNDFYDWQDIAATITTWILPILGILLQAPFESNAFRRTILATSRWIGSPMASLAYIMWNIKVSGKAAMMVDMSIPYDGQIPGKDSDFASMRDSMYILTNMNQYSIKPSISLKNEAEGLLRIALFSKDLKLRTVDGNSLDKVRRHYAQRLREGRRRGVVPVYISTMWFLFSLGISIQAAFGVIGNNATAHDLALGLLLAWLPVLILCSVVDRNPVAADDIRRKLNKLVDLVRISLMDDAIRNEFIESFSDRPESQRMREWVGNISNQCEYMNDFFVRFAGQGRVRWHYGVAHPILSDIENSYIADHGRYWLRNEQEARTNLVLGSVGEGLVWFDLRELWQILSAVSIVMLSCFGSFIISFYTPTVGLGCRSGGYLIFATISVGLLICELLVWWWSSPTHVEQPEWLVPVSTRLQSTATFHMMEEGSRNLFRRAQRTFSGFRGRSERMFVRGALRMSSLVHFHDSPERIDDLERSLQRSIKLMHYWGLKEWSKYLFFRPAEFINMVWLSYIVMAQTIGSYRNCGCMTSVWGTSGGYLDFTQSDVTDNPFIMYYWSGGTVVGSLGLVFGMIYIVTEWCLQSHLNTENFGDARRGLQRTRTFRRVTYPIRFVLRHVIGWFTSRYAKFCTWIGVPCRQQKSLIWTRNITYRPTIQGVGLDTETQEYDPSYAPLQRLGSDGSHIPLIVIPPTIQRKEVGSGVSPRLSYDRVSPSPSPSFDRLSLSFDSPVFSPAEIFRQTPAGRGRRRGSSSPGIAPDSLRPSAERVRSNSNPGAREEFLQAVSLPAARERRYSDGPLSPPENVRRSGARVRSVSDLSEASALGIFTTDVGRGEV